MNKLPSDISNKLKLLNAAYNSVLDMETFDELIAAWDETFLKEFFSEQLQDKDFDLSLEEVEQHFGRALMLEPAEKDVRDLESELEAETLPAFVLDDYGKVTFRNKPCYTVFPFAEFVTLDDIPLQDASELKSKFKAQVSATKDEDTGGLVRVYDANNKTYLLHLSSIDESINDRKAVLVRILETIWSNKLGMILSAAFGLTDAEIETARLLTLGYNPSQISDKRERSLDTVRNQIKSILSKTEAQGQTELIRLLTLMSQVSVHASSANAEEENETWRSGQFSVQRIDIRGRRLAYAQYGNRNGAVLFYVTASSLPEETQKFRTYLEEAGLNVIAPYRPSFGESEPAEHSNGLEGYVEDCIELIEKLGLQDIHVAGHREGGVFAARLANALQDKAWSLSIINTGAPVEDWKTLHQGSLVARRSLVTAIKAPKALRMGYRVAAKIFNSGLSGENKILDVFYSGSPIDAATYSEPALKEITRNNIAYCFQDTDSIVADIALWASDWSEDINSLHGRTRVQFIHAEEHDFMLAEWVRDFCRNYPDAHARIVPRSGQTMLYTHPRKVVDHLNSLIRGSTP